MTQRYTWTELQEIAKRHNIVVEPPPAPKPEKPDPAIAELRRTIEARRTKTKAKAATRGTELPPRTPRPRYLNADGEEWTGGGWKPIDPKREAFLQRQGAGGRVLRVGDPGGATVAEVGNALWIRRGCLIDGDPMVVWDKITVGKFDPAWRGGLCIADHQWWTAAPITEKRSWDGIGRHVTDRLAEEGFLPGATLERERRVSPTHSTIDVFYLRDWPGKCWASRVLAAGDPSIQVPPSRPFGYLAGPLKVPALEEVST